jgi:hypothetical protein
MTWRRILEFPVTCAPHQNAHFFPTNPRFLIEHKMVNNARIIEALADLDTQEVPNFSATAEKYDVVRSTLTRRYYGQTTSIEECISMHRQCLTRSEEKALIGLINRLTDRKLPPTPRIIKNLVEEIRGSTVVGRSVSYCGTQRLLSVRPLLWWLTQTHSFFSSSRRSRVARYILVHRVSSYEILRYVISSAYDTLYLLA